MLPKPIRRLGDPLESRGATESGNEDRIVSVLVGDEVSDNLSNVNVIEKTRQWFKDHLQGVVIERANMAPIRFTGKGWNKFKNGLKTDVDKARLAPAIRPIIEQGEYRGRFPLDKPRTDGIVAFHHFRANVQLGDSIYDVGVSVGEDNKGNLFYNLNKDPDHLLRKRKRSTVTQEVARGAEREHTSAGNTSKEESLPETSETTGVVLDTIISPNKGLSKKPLESRTPQETPRAQSPRTGKTSKAQLQGVIEQLGLADKNLEAVQVFAVKDVAELKRLTGYDRGSDSEGLYFPATENPDGTSSPAEIYLIGENISDVRRAMEVLEHELVGHFGMESMLGG